MQDRNTFSSVCNPGFMVSRPDRGRNGKSMKFLLSVPYALKIIKKELMNTIQLIPFLVLI